MTNIIHLAVKGASQCEAERFKNQTHERLSPEELLDCAERLRDLMWTVASSLETMQRRMEEPS